MTRIILIPKPEENVMTKGNYGTLSFINIATISWTQHWALFGLDEVIYIFYLDLANGLFWFGRFFTATTTWEGPNMNELDSQTLSISPFGPKSKVTEVSLCLESLHFY